ncbi:tetratricopeptide repeat protein [Microbulbifer sp. SAOS-129_SWC]|uniref:tetratricopeptide repeat protein n=1 Tax=Microbulbifer sp. SAOS-129_SWC TaxID=3145235 RepID=UPI003216A73C
MIPYKMAAKTGSPVLFAPLSRLAKRLFLAACKSSGLALALLWTFIPVANAASYRPDSESTVIATWPADQSRINRQQEDQATAADPQPLLNTVEELLRRARRPGQSFYFDIAAARLQPFIEDNTDNPRIWYQWAYLLQHQHQFSDSLQALQRALALSPQNSDMLIMKARVLQVQGRPRQARQACLRLIGNSDLLSAQFCALDAAADSGAPAQQYSALVDAVKRSGLPANGRRSWMAYTLAAMAQRLGKIEQALYWLQQQPDRESSYYWDQWADLQLERGAARQVLQQLSALDTGGNPLDDGLLLRLALAEKQLGGDHWQQQMAERVELREQRHDNLHAANIARYYLDVCRDAQRALRWAKINFSNAKEPRDRLLLDRARARVQPRMQESAL